LWFPPVIISVHRKELEISLGSRAGKSVSIKPMWNFLRNVDSDLDFEEDREIQSVIEELRMVALCRSRLPWKKEIDIQRHLC
jgi:hypothetical protein